MAAVDGRGRTCLRSLRSATPLNLRATPDGVYLVGGAAGPLGGDHLELDVEVGPGASLTLRTAAAAVALPGANGEASTLAVRAGVGEGATLRWLPEPSVAALGCRHHVQTHLVLAPGSRLVWREELLLGRHGEEPGCWRARSVVDLDGAPLWRHELCLGPEVPGDDGPAVLGGSRAVGSVLVVDPAWAAGGPEPTVMSDTAAVLPLGGPAVVVTALAYDAVSLRARLDEGWRAAMSEKS
ncbi:MAG: urease accessory protein UreD [Actinomycetota bacterium]|nr:urease accessory protein UreD [Actinomycetota bacterium]